ncbi:MAG: heat-inducible transcriptional repressor HrcA [Betaproteobacteria bacterium]|jgi:heat-inducible transcription repressor HrcA|nr:heat-inducible transcriptional repressor HrcA [Betaproteobacteria bacterium]
MLNDRAQALLKVLVEKYIDEGQPVGSRALSRLSGMDLSAATIRNVMADLEELGFITSPHTSAGRVPTPRGYRFFVDSLLTIQPLTHATVNQVESHLHPADTQQLMATASQLLSELTAFAGIVRTPRRHLAGFQRVEFMRLSETRLLLILVTLEGEVQNRILPVSQSYSTEQLTEAARYLNEYGAGRDFDKIVEGLRQELSGLRSDIRLLTSQALEFGESVLRLGRDDYVLRGETRLIGHGDMSGNLMRLRRLFDLFEQKTSLLQLLDASQNSEGVRIFIGGESGQSPLDEFSLVTAPYEVDGQVVGTLGVIGPTRMAYERVIPIVDITARLLSSALSQH